MKDQEGKKVCEKICIKYKKYFTETFEMFHKAYGRVCLSRTLMLRMAQKSVTCPNRCLIIREVPDNLTSVQACVMILTKKNANTTCFG